MASGGQLKAVRVRLLGGFLVSIGSRTLEEGAWRLRKAASLVKLLALAPGHRLHRERVMDLLWPELGARDASNNLRQALHVARRTLDPDSAAASRYISFLDERLALCPEAQLWVDVEAFEDAASTARRSRSPAAYWAAVELYGGELLPGDLYEEWAEGRRSELQGLHLALLTELATLYEERGELAPAIEVLWRVVTEEPILEEAHVGLMRLHALSGRQGEALRQYERLRKTLQRELGTEPGETSRRLHEEIAAGTFPPSRTLRVGLPPEQRTDASRHNLPAARASFVGRERELAEVKRELTTTCLLTLTGVGGSGKTRLALEVARDLLGEYPDGVWLAELAPLSEPELVPQAVASAVGVSEQPGRPLPDTLVGALRDRELLLVLDNCEHLVEAAARLVDLLLDCCPRLRTLATSREALGVVGELTWAVPSLPMPDLRRPPAVGEELEGYGSARLFLERARQRDPTLVLSQENAKAVAEICRRLDGIPLAIELAAAWVRTLTIEQIAGRIGDALKFLTRGGRTVVPRQRTLRGTLDWSYDLLDESERTLFNRLSAFAGGWTLEATEAVGAGEGIGEEEVLDLLSRLVDKSLVVTEATVDGDLRYRMLEPVRQYARERLEESDEAEDVRRRHTAFFLALAEEAEPELTGSQQRSWLERLDSEHDNLRTALSWALEREEAELGLQLSGALWRFWYARGYLGEGRRWLEEILAHSGTASRPVRARALDGAGWLAEVQGDYERARAEYEESLELYRGAEDERGVACSMGSLGSVALAQGNHERSAALLEESLATLRRLGSERDVTSALTNLGILALSRGDTARAVELFEETLALSRKSGDAQGTAACLSNLGYATLIYGDYKRAAALFEESLKVEREVGYADGMAISLINLGIVALFEGDHERALALLGESLTTLREVRDKQTIAQCLEAMAGVAEAQEKRVRAARLWGAAQALREDIGAPLPPDERTLHEPHVAATRSRLGEEGWEAAFTEGRAMELERAVEYALLEEAATPAPEKSPGKLTRREKEVASLVARGLTNRQIAKELVVSERTVDHHVSNILKKLNLRSREQVTPSLAEQRPDHPGLP